MGFGGISIWQLLIVLAIIVLLFGTKKLRSLGTDLGSAIKGFRNSVKDENQADSDNRPAQLSDQAASNSETANSKPSTTPADKDRN